MLRRKLLSRIGLLIGAFVVGAVIAIVLLQGIIDDIDTLNRDSALLVDGVQELIAAVVAVETERLEPPGVDDAAHAQAMVTIREALTRMRAHPLTQAPDGDGAEAFARVEASLAPMLAGEEAHGAWASGSVRDLGRIVSVYVASERTGLGWHFRVLVLGLTLAAIVFVNISVIVLLRIVSMILRPVDQLGAASQALADGRFGQRVELDRDDEFGELAHVFNRMAAQLEANEERKMDTLRQVAVTLNHGLNNAINAIDLQLKLVDRDAGPNAMLKERLERIHQSLAGMTRAVQALTKVRRIVLTEYMPGQLMLDLGRSIEADPLDEPASTPAAATPAGRST